MLPATVPDFAAANVYPISAFVAAAGMTWHGLVTAPRLADGEAADGEAGGEAGGEADDGEGAGEAGVADAAGGVVDAWGAGGSVDCDPFDPQPASRMAAAASPTTIFVRTMVAPRWFG
ncbi:MAG: hypothetical protein ACR2LI_02530 [Propionibacteriaceae bacterium]